MKYCFEACFPNGERYIQYGSHYILVTTEMLLKHGDPYGDPWIPRHLSQIFIDLFKEAVDCGYENMIILRTSQPEYREEIPIYEFNMCVGDLT